MLFVFFFYVFLVAFHSFFLACFLTKTKKIKRKKITKTELLFSTLIEVQQIKQNLIKNCENWHTLEWNASAAFVHIKIALFTSPTVGINDTRYGNTIFRQTFLLSQYSFIWLQYLKCSNTIFFWQLLVAKISLWKNGKQLNVEEDLTSV